MFVAQTAQALFGSARCQLVRLDLAPDVFGQWEYFHRYGSRVSHFSCFHFVRRDDLKLYIYIYVWIPGSGMCPGFSTLTEPLFSLQVDSEPSMMAMRSAPVVRIATKESVMLLVGKSFQHFCL